MKAILFETPGGPEVLRWSEAVLMSCGNEEVQIRVEAAGVNAADVLQRKGKYPAPSGASPILGLEVAGVISAVGSKVRRWKPGDRVAALLNGGGYAEFVNVPEGQCLPWIPGLSVEQMAALPEAACTVFSNVIEIGKLHPEESLLIHGGTSGIGSFAIPFALAQGCKVFTTSGSDAKCDACLGWGASSAINYQTQDFSQVILEQTQGRGVDVILDLVGGKYLAKNLSCMAEQGRLVCISTQGGRTGELDMGLMMRKRLTITGSMLRPRSVAEKSRLVSEVENRVWPWIQSGKIRPVIDSVWMIEEAGKAHEKLESGRVLGKVILRVS